MFFGYYWLFLCLWDSNDVDDGNDNDSGDDDSDGDNDGNADVDHDNGHGDGGDNNHYDGDVDHDLGEQRLVSRKATSELVHQQDGKLHRAKSKYLLPKGNSNFPSECKVWESIISGCNICKIEEGTLSRSDNSPPLSLFIADWKTL